MNEIYIFMCLLHVFQFIWSSYFFLSFIIIIIFLLFYGILKFITLSDGAAMILRDYLISFLSYSEKVKIFSSVSVIIYFLLWLLW